MRCYLELTLMRSNAIAAVLVATSFAASAADMTIQGRPYNSPAASSSSWNGAYVGVSGGWATGSSKHVSDATNGGIDIASSYHMRGALIGATVGYNWDVGSGLVGVEGDWSWTNKKGSANDTPPFPATFVSGTQERWLATMRARAGYAFSNDWLLYVTGGLALASIKATVISPDVSDSEAKIRLGWTIGGGVETQIWGNWSAKAEYLYVKFGNAGYLANPPAPIVVRGNVPVTGNVFRVGVNYRFGGQL